MRINNFIRTHFWLITQKQRLQNRETFAMMAKARANKSASTVNLHGNL